jgi:hypothetical protein
MNFRSKNRLSNKVGGQNHLNDDVLFASTDWYGIPMMGAIQKMAAVKKKPSL